MKNLKFCFFNVYKKLIWNKLFNNIVLLSIHRLKSGSYVLFKT